MVCVVLGLAAVSAGSSGLDCLPAEADAAGGGGISAAEFWSTAEPCAC